MKTIHCNIFIDVLSLQILLPCRVAPQSTVNVIFSSVVITATVTTSLGTTSNKTLIGLAALERGRRELCT